MWQPGNLVDRAGCLLQPVSGKCSGVSVGGAKCGSQISEISKHRDSVRYDVPDLGSKPIPMSADSGI